MSTIFLDPVQMDATAGVVGQHAREAESLVVDLESTCSAQVPAALAGWLAEELRDVTVHVRMVALLYTVAALDTALRAQQIQADQSLATAAPALVSAAPAFAETPLVGGFVLGATELVSNPFAGSSLVGGLVVGATEPMGGPSTGWGQGSGLFLGATPGSAGAHTVTTFSNGLSSEAFAAQNAPWSPTSPLGAGGSSGLPSLIDALDRNGVITGNIVAPRGLDLVAPGIYEGRSGRQGGISETIRDPRTGDLDF